MIKIRFGFGLFTSSIQHYDLVLILDEHLIVFNSTIGLKIKFDVSPGKLNSSKLIFHRQTIYKFQFDNLIENSIL